MNIFETKPRWPGATQICLETNLPAFPTRKAMKGFQEKIAVSSVREWECDACGCFHFDPKYPPPAGSSSGNSRRQSGDGEQAEVLEMLAGIRNSTTPTVSRKSYERTGRFTKQHLEYLYSDRVEAARKEVDRITPF